MLGEVVAALDRENLGTGPGGMNSHELSDAESRSTRLGRYCARHRSFR